MSDLVRNDLGQKTYLRTSNDGHLKIDIEDATISGTGLATEPKQDDMITKLTSVDGKISKGNSATGVGDELQQVLMYGKKPDGTLQPLETSGDRLLVDVVELAASGQITTSTALSSVQVCGYDTGTNQFKTMNVDGSGNLQVDVASGSVSISSAVIKGNDGADGSGTDRTILTDGNGALIVDVSSDSVATSNGLTSEQRVQVCGTNDGTNLRTMRTDDDGHLQVDVLSGGGGDATATNQTSMITKLNEIELNTQAVSDALYSDGTAIGASDKGIMIMGEDNSNNAHPIHITSNGDVEVEIADFVKGQATMTNSFPVVIASDQSVVAVSGTITETNSGDSLTKLTEIDNAVDAMSLKLPASLGQKANASSLSICRSSTTGAFDVSARTTIGTASSSTKLLCDSAGRLAVNNGLQTSNLGLHLSGGSSTTMTIGSGLVGTTKNVSLSDIRVAFLEPSIIGCKITASSTGGAGNDYTFEASFDGGSTYQEQTLNNLIGNSKSTIIGNLGDGDSFDGIFHLGTHFRFKMTNNSGASCDYTIQLVAHGVDFNQA